MLTTFNRNAELNAAGIPTSANIHTKASLEPALKANPGKRNRELTTYEIYVSSDIPTYNMQHPIRMDNFIVR